MELTEHQKAALDAVEKYGSASKAAKALGIEGGTFRRRVREAKAKLASQGYAPEHDMVKTCPDGYFVKGVSTLYTQGENGTQVAAQWVKTQADAKRQAELIQEAVQAWCEEAKGIIKPVKSKIKHHDQELLTIYPLGDPHFGMYAWADETGKDFDLDIAENQLLQAIDYLVDKSPPSGRGVLCNLGDMFHSDNMDGVTARSGHSLDMDGRLQKVIHVGVRALRRCIHRMLEKHDTVDVVNAPGNHDHVLALALNVMMANIYENEPRVRVHSQPTMRHYLRHGKVLIGVVHGHQTKDNDLGAIMATEKPQWWGTTEYRYFYRGHHHQDKVTELRGCKVEQFRTLAPKDAYAAGGGYLSGQDMKAIVHHAEYGEIARHTFAINMFKGSES
jgi:hypothetical protein